MARTPEEYHALLLQLLDANPTSQKYWAAMTEYDKQMCLDWIVAAPTDVLREGRVHHLVGSLWGRFNAFYHFGLLTFVELNMVWGRPRLLAQLTPEEQTLAVQERRVLGASHTRYHDGSDVYFRVLTPGDRLSDELTLVYPRPCVLTQEWVGGLGSNPWETVYELQSFYDPLPPSSWRPAEPLRLAPRPAFPPSARHRRDVWALAANWAWQRVVSASADGTLLVWNPATGAALNRLAGHTAPVWTVALTPDGQRAVSGSWDKTLRVWDLASGETLHVLAGHRDEIYAVAITPDGRRAVSGSRDETLRIWDLDSGQQLHVQSHRLEIWGVAVTPDGERAASASGDKTLRLWDLATGQQLHELRGHTSTVERVVITADGTRAISGGIDTTLRVWDLATGETLHLLAGHTQGVLAVALTPDQQRVVSSSTDGTVRVWDLDTGWPLHALEGHTAPVWGLSLTGDGQRIVSAGRDGKVCIWDLETGRRLAMLATQDEFLRCCVSPDGTTIVAGDRGGQVHFIRIHGS